MMTYLLQNFIYHKYHRHVYRQDLHAITSRMRSQLPILGNVVPDAHLESKGEKVQDFHYRLKIDQHFYFHAICALPADFEFFDNCDHIFALF